MKFQTRDILPLAAIVGIIALAVMGLNFWTGLGLFALDIGLLILFARRKHDKSSSRTIPPIKTVVSEFELSDPPAEPKPVGSEFYQPLLTALRMGGQDLNVPVVLTDAEPIVAQDIIIAIAEIMREKGDSIPQMAKYMPAMYSLIWDHVGEALERYSDIALIKVHIASSVYFKVMLDQVKS